MEQNSEHPLARALVEGGKERGISLSSAEEFDSITGGGVRGKVDGKQVLIGKRSLLEENGVSETDALDDPSGTTGTAGPDGDVRRRRWKIGGDCGGVRSDQGIDRRGGETLHDLGLKIIMLTGDNPRTAKTVADAIGHR